MYYVLLLSFTSVVTIMVFTALEGLGSRFRLLHLVQRVLNPSVCYLHLVCVISSLMSGEDRVSE